MSEKHFTVLAGEHGDQHRRFNYDLCTAVDLIKLGVALEKMVKAGRLDPRVADIYKKIAEGLLAALRSENDRAFGFKPRGLLIGRSNEFEFKYEQAGSRGPYEEPECEHEFFDYMIDMKRSSLHPSILNLVHNEVCKLCHWNQSNGSIVSKEDWEKFAIPQLKALKEE